MHFSSALLLCLSLLSAAPASAQVTLPPEPIDAMQLDAAARARALIEAMPDGAARHQAATFLAYRFMMRGNCPEALLVLNRELRGVTDATALGGLVTGALTGRDPRCMARVAARIDAVLRGGSLEDTARAELRFRGRTLFALAGQMNRAAGMPSADPAPLEIVPDEMRAFEFTAGNTIVHVSRADPPRRLQTLLLDRLWAYRRTPLELGLARALSARLPAERDFLTRAGWVEVAYVLFAAGDREAAQRVLTAGDVGYVSLAGLEAEVAWQNGDFERVAAIMAANDWGGEIGTLGKLFERRPSVLLPYVDTDTIFNAASREGFDLHALSSSLDRAGLRDSAERAARAAVGRSAENEYEKAPRAHSLARIGDFDGARRLLAAAEAQKRNPLWPFRIGIARAAALRGNRAELDRAIAAAPDSERNAMLMSALAAVARTDPALRQDLEDRLEARYAAMGGFNVSEGDLAWLARAGVRTRLILTHVRRFERGRQGAAAALRIANAARIQGLRESALAIAEAAEALLPEGPQADAELVELADFYWRLGLPEKAIALATRISHRVGQVDAMTRALYPRHVEPPLRLSFHNNL